MYILNIIRNIYAILSREQKATMLLLQLFFAFAAIVQVVGIASIAPFVGIISNPESIQTNTMLSAIYNFFNFNSNNEFILFFALASIGMILISNGVSALTLWLQLKFSIHLGGELQYQLFNNLIHRNYLFHKSVNYNDLIAIICADAPRFIYMVLQPYLLLCSQLFVAAIILTGLLILNPLAAIGSALIVGGAYLGTYLIIKKTLKKHGTIITARSRAIQATLSEAFIGIKDIKLRAIEHKYSRKYESINRNGLNSSAFISLSGDLPRFAIETISFSAILLFALYLLNNQSSTTSVVSILSIYAIAGYKLLPTMQQIYKSASSLSANGAVLQDIQLYLDNTNIFDAATESMPLSTVGTITAQNITYAYPQSTRNALSNVSLIFNKGELNTIAGSSGSGKSTLADIVLGLLSPSSGDIFVDDIKLSNTTIYSYQGCIGYVPQNIFILDADVIANVAFGENIEDIDLNRVIYSLEQASALDFVKKLPQALETILGQDGKLLSGGQRQRIGIARALYRNNKVLVLDEPTSALDIESEYEFMQLLNRLKEKILIVVISHRPAAIKYSDKIAVIDDGKMIAQGDYATLFRENNYFKGMIEKGFVD